LLFFLLAFSEGGVEAREFGVELPEIETEGGESLLVEGDESGEGRGVVL
jgi:hypothetical protein